MQINSYVNRALSWFQDTTFRKIFFNAGRLLSANALAAFLSLISATLTARTIGPDGYGVLAIIIVYSQTIGKLVSFNAWQGIIKYGSDLLRTSDTAGLRQLFKFGYSLDIACGITGFLVAAVLSKPVVHWLGWDAGIRPLILLYSVLILFSWTGTPVAVLRMFDRFDLLGSVTIAGAAINLIGVGWAFLTHQDLSGLVKVYLLSAIFSQIIQVLMSYWLLSKKGIKNVFFQTMNGFNSKFSGLWSFIWNTNISLTLRMVSHEADELLLAFLVTPVEIGFYKTAKQFSKVLPMFADPLSQVVFPQLASLWANQKKYQFRSLIKRATAISMVIAFAGWLGFLLFGKGIISVTFGSLFLDAYPITVFYMLAMVIFLCGIALTPSMLAIGLAKESFHSNLIATAVYLVLIILFVDRVGIIGASIAYVGFFVVWLTARIMYLAPYLRPDQN